MQNRCHRPGAADRAANCPGLHAVGMRAIWTGYVTFGLVTIPIHLYAATEERGTGFHQVHTSDGARIRHRRVCAREDVEVPQSEIARGFERHSTPSEQS